MRWIKDFQLYLFDFDGLLVDTEVLHYEAYKKVFATRGDNFPLTVSRFFALAHKSGAALREALAPFVADWENFYQEKRDCYQDFLYSGSVDLMPGAERFLTALAEAELRRCIVTNSSLANLEQIALSQPILKTLPWITREEYRDPKPSPECYQLAITRYGQPGDQIIGFEDSPRGFQALRAAAVDLPVFVTTIHTPLQGALCVTSLEKIICNSVTFP